MTQNKYLNSGFFQILYDGVHLNLPLIFWHIFEIEKLSLFCFLTVELELEH
jgi:hypothetical protein